jgi:hypothetical protein
MSLVPLAGISLYCFLVHSCLLRACEHSSSVKTQLTFQPSSEADVQFKPSVLLINLD